MIEYRLDRLSIRVTPATGQLAGELARFSLGHRTSHSGGDREVVELSVRPLPPEGNPFPQIPGQPLPVEARREYESLHFASIGCRAEYNLETRRGAVQALPEWLVGGLENFIRLIYSYFLAARGGFILHSFGFAWNDSAYLFFGTSGSGKSTSASFYDGLPPGPEKGPILSDDIIQVIPDPHGGYRASQTPLEQRFPPVEGSWRIAGAYRLVKDKRVYIRPAAPAEAVSYLLQSVLFISEDREKVPDLLGVLEKFGQSCPVGDLHFRPDPEFLKVVCKKYNIPEISTPI